ncbi:MAG: hypothetical protein CVT61_00195 [Actinobacteria bacterium HGW-Actinobacteria-11]|nr:MAG: hypothetical protein CVT61_00195 [Actinobacteria bacterium HGW-Actinobacteria-11]
MTIAADKEKIPHGGNRRDLKTEQKENDQMSQITPGDREAYRDYVQKAIALATSTSIQDRIKTDLEYPADRTPHGIELRADGHAKTLRAFRKAEAAFLSAVTA